MRRSHSCKICLESSRVCATITACVAASEMSFTSRMGKNLERLSCAGIRLHNKVDLVEDTWDSGELHEHCCLDFVLAQMFNVQL